MVEFYLLMFLRFPLRKKEHKSYFGKNQTLDFRTSRRAGYLLLDHSGAECYAIIIRKIKNRGPCGGGGLELVKPAREPASNRPKPCASLKNAPRILPIHRSLLTLVGRKQSVVAMISFSLRDLPVRDFDSRAQGFSTPLARRRSSCPPSSPNLVRAHPIERCCALSGFPRRQCSLPLACHHLLKGPKLELGRGVPLVIEHHPQTTIIPPPRLNRPADS